MTMRRLLLPLLAAATFAALPAASASAAACSAAGVLTDADGNVFGFQNDSDIDTGNRDAFGNTGQPYFDVEYNGGFDTDDNAGCAYADSNQSWVFPPDTLSLPGQLRMQIKWFVPSSGASFARQLIVITNPHATARTLQLFRWGDNDYDTTDITSSSSGDTTATAADDWFVYNNATDATDPHIAYVWQSSDPRRRHAAEDLSNTCCGDPHEVVADGFGQPTVRYGHVSFAPGETKTFMTFYAMRATAEAARQAAIELAGGGDRNFTALTAGEQRALQNYVAPDADGDGVANGSDNCVYAANADQADADRDGAGNACDGDDDGDGISDADETARGLSATSADTDGDGRGDAVDTCPRVAGAAADGCPLVVVAGPQRVAGPTRIVPRAVSARATSRRRGSRLTVSTTGRLGLPPGLTAAQACDFGLMTIVVKAGSRTISTRIVELNRDCSFRSSAVFRGRSRFRRAKRLDVIATFNGNAFMLRRVASRQRVPVR